jgi:hypothetical protein
MRVIRIGAVGVIAALGVVSLVATAQAVNLPREHDRGFFLRMSAGLGSARTSWDVPANGGAYEWEASGIAGDANFAIGAIVAPNLALHGTLLGWTVSEPDLEIGGLEFNTNDVTLSLSGFGAGLTYYVHPANVYFSGSICAASLTLEYEDEGVTVSAESDTGVAFDLTVGKEWWVGARWGLGIAGDLGLHSIPVADADDNMTGMNFGVRFSATFN